MPLNKTETAILDGLAQTQVICIRCAASLAEYRRGDRCIAALDDPCPGFRWVETVLATPTTSTQQ